MRIQACEDIQTAAAITLELSRSSIHKIEDVWSREMIEFDVYPTPETVTPDKLGEIVFRSIGHYLERPGHVLLPDGMIPGDEFEKESKNKLLRVQKFWEYWHGSPTLNNQIPRLVSMIPNTTRDHDLTANCLRSISTLNHSKTRRLKTQSTQFPWWSMLALTSWRSGSTVHFWVS